MNLANFTLAKTSLIRLGCPIEVEGLLANRALGRPIVAVTNRKEWGKTASDYCPPVVVVCGAETRKRMLAQGHTKAWAWVENGAVQVNADDSIGYDEFMTRLQSQLQAKYYGGRESLPGQPVPAITQIFPFENTLNYRMGEADKSSHYTFSAESRNPVILDAMAMRPLVIRYVKPNPTRTELVSHIIMSTPDIEKAVAQYLALTKGARSIRPNFQPYAATYDTKINAMLQAKGVDAFEFAMWVASKKGKANKGNQ